MNKNKLDGKYNLQEFEEQLYKNIRYAFDEKIQDVLVCFNRIFRKLLNLKMLREFIIYYFNINRKVCVVC